MSPAIISAYVWLTSAIVAHVTLFGFIFAIIRLPTTDEYPDKGHLCDFCLTQKVFFQVNVPRAAEIGSLRLWHDAARNTECEGAQLSTGEVCSKGEGSASKRV